MRGLDGSPEEMKAPGGDSISRLVVGPGDESEEERELRIRNLFDSFDISKLGYLESQQIEAGLFPYQKKYVEELVGAVDVNHDGHIDFAEFRRYMDMKEVELYKLFQSIDASHDGALQPEELRVALESAGVDDFLQQNCVVLSSAELHFDLCAIHNAIFKV